IPNPTPVLDDRFGNAAAAVGGNFQISDETDDTGAQNAGSVSLFDGATGALLHTFNNPHPGSDDQFGASVAAVGSNILIGADADETAATNAGSVSLFEGASLAFGPAGAGPHDLTLRRNGDQLELVNNATSAVLRSSLMDETTSVLIVGAPGQANTLTI